jgi:two-component sensor histidine kinase/putative methionine-R-sulfoxide reductase with GAF domain
MLAMVSREAVPQQPHTFAQTLLSSGLTADEQTLVPLRRVLEQRSAFAELYTVTLLHPSLEALLDEAARVAAKGCHAAQAKILEHKAEAGEFLLLAGWHIKPGFVGRLIGSAGAGSPPSQSLAEQRPVVVPDVRLRGDYDLPRIFAEHDVASSANVPIATSEGLFGVLEVDSPKPNSFDALDLSFLISIAGIIGSAVERVRREAALRVELDARTALLREQQHRVRNHLQTMQAMLHRHAIEAPDAETKRRFKDIERRVLTLASLYDHLLGTNLSEHVDLAAYLHALTEGLRRFYEPEANGITLRCGPHDAVTMMVLDACTAVGIVVAELVANALEHAFDARGGTITVRLRGDNRSVRVSVADNGKGMSGGEEGRSIGLGLARRLLATFGGSLTREPSHSGTIWCIELPHPWGSPVQRQHYCEFPRDK